MRTKQTAEEAAQKRKLRRARGDAYTKLLRRQAEKHLRSARNYDKLDKVQCHTDGGHSDYYDRSREQWSMYHAVLGCWAIYMEFKGWDK